MSTKYILTEDIKSSMKKGFVYGVKGTEVTEVSRNGHVVIVEDKKGERYSANVKKLIPKPIN